MIISEVTVRPGYVSRLPRKLRALPKPSWRSESLQTFGDADVGTRVVVHVAKNVEFNSILDLWRPIYDILKPVANLYSV